MRYYEAAQRDDVAAMRGLLSKGSIALMEKAAAEQRTTVDELLKRESTVKFPKPPETRNEKIEGDTATVEVKNETNGQFDMTMPFVREDGSWKLARDKYIEEILRKANEAREKLVKDVAEASNSNTQPKNQAK